MNHYTGGPSQCGAVRGELPELAFGIVTGRARAECLGHVAYCQWCSTELERLSVVADTLIQLALVALLPGIVLVANGALPTALLIAYGGAVGLAHSNIRLSFGPLGRIFVSPNYHRIHHRLEGRQDVNLGFALTIWDQLFGRAIFPTRATISIAPGLPGRPLAVEFGAQRPHHLSVFVRQLLAPFRPVRDLSDSFDVNSDGPPAVRQWSVVLRP